MRLRAHRLNSASDGCIHHVVRFAADARPVNSHCLLLLDRGSLLICGGQGGLATRRVHGCARRVYKLVQGGHARVGGAVAGASQLLRVQVDGTAGQKHLILVLAALIQLRRQWNLMLVVETGRRGACIDDLVLQVL